MGRRGPEWGRLPEELDWTGHQAAPRSQQVPFLRGDEPFEIQGAHAKHATLRGSLPGVRARCFARRKPEAGGLFEEVTLRLDTVVLDPDALKLDLVRRGAVTVPDERAPDVEALHFLVEEAASGGISLADARARFA